MFWDTFRDALEVGIADAFSGFPFLETGPGAAIPAMIGSAAEGGLISDRNDRRNQNGRKCCCGTSCNCK